MPSIGGSPAAGARRDPQDEQPTTVIGRVGDRRSADPEPQVDQVHAPRLRGSDVGERAVAGRGLRSIEMISGLLGGGLLLAGLVLLVLQFAAPGLVTAGRGPGWAAVVAHLGVGVVAEVLRAARTRLRAPARWLVAGVVILATVGVLLLIWW